VSPRRSLALLSLALSSGLCVALEAARVLYSGTNDYGFLVWNLFLAWIPFGLALAVYDGHRRGRLRLGLAALWLLFFPNAPYIVTDFVHLGNLGGAPLWYDLILTAAFAWSGLALGFASLLLLQTVVRARFGARRSWEFVGATLALASFGVYLGRFLRLNSWDFFLQPGVLVARLDLASPVKAAAVTVALTSFLGVAYLMLYGLTGLRRELDPE